MARTKKKSGGTGGLLLMIILSFAVYKDPSLLSQVSNAMASASIGGGHEAGLSKEQAYAQRVFGISNSAMNNCLIPLWNQESGWNANAVNQKSGAYGIPQALPAAHGHPYALGDWKTQIRWGKDYIDSTYGGSVCAAWQHEQADNWY